MNQVMPFEVAVPEADLDTLRSRLRDTRWAADLGNNEWRYGVQREWLEELVGYWREEYDWRAAERAINAFPAYLTQIDSQPIHFVHVRGKGPNPTPLLLCHGWPWTFWDYAAVIGPLTDPGAHGGDPAHCFDVIVPSLPGAGFSMPLKLTGLGARRIAELFHTLMTDVLGYARYGVGGGDWGSIITGEMGHAFSDSLIGVWLTLPYVPGVNLRELGPGDFAPDERWMWERALAARPSIMSHRTVHQIDPQTLAYALVDSPVGTAAWILGRRREWSDHDEDLFAVFDRDFLCTTASIYWLNGSIGTSLRIYHEYFHTGGPPPPRHDRLPAITAPTAFAVFPKELLLLPRAHAARITNLVRWSVQPRGGHFAPAEQPGLVVADLQEFFRDLR
ncbi:MAG: epoxide hydrolase family protein [Sporichthyaceae bacterium]